MSADPSLENPRATFAAVASALADAAAAFLSNPTPLTTRARPSV
jgi:hypothetical protein